MSTLLIQLLLRQKPKPKPNSDGGFTLIESLMAIVVTTIILVAITPPIFVTVATRVQNRRAEQAMQLAQGEIDRVRVLIEQENYTNLATELPAVVLASNSTTDLNTTAAPTAVFPQVKTSKTDCPNRYTGATIPAVTEVLPVDVNNDCQPDFLVQTFRDTGEMLTTPAPALKPVLMASRVGVRVYAAVAQPQIGSLDTQPASLKFTTGLGQQQRRPLSVLISAVARTDSNVSLCHYQNYLNNTPTRACN